MTVRIVLSRWQGPAAAPGCRPMTKTLLVGLLVLVGCKETGATGAPGGEGPAGRDGAPGAVGPAGAAGKDGAPGKDSAQSGSRIVAKTLVGSDGSRQFVGWRDSTLGVDCAFATASDGRTRCLPGAPASGWTPAIIYGDAACSVAVGIGYEGGAPPCNGASLSPYIQIVQPAACDAGAVATVLAVPVGAAVSCPASSWILTGGACVAGCPSSKGGHAATIVDPSTLVEGTVQ